MKSLIFNQISFQDGKDDNFIKLARKTLPLFNLEVFLWDFNIEKISYGHFEVTLIIHFTFEGKTKVMEHSYPTTDTELVDKLKVDVGPLKRKTIINIIETDSFKEELADILEQLEYEY
jgi:hypothetical protein